MGRGNGSKSTAQREKTIIAKHESKKVSASMQARWDKMKNKGKWRYILVDVMLLRQIFLVVALLLSFEFLLFRNTNLTVMNGWWLIIARVVLAALNGVVVGLLEWILIEKLVFKRFTHLLQLWWQFVLVYGILGYGVPLGLCMPYLPEGIVNVILFVGIYLGMGLVFGAVMFGFSAYKGASGWEQFISPEKK